jgi:hypothetical protein
MAFKRGRRVRPEFANKERFKQMTALEKMLEVFRVSDLVPHLVGEKGIGKSAQVRSYAERMGMGYVKVEFANVDRIDFNGLLKFYDYIKGSGNPMMDKVAEYLNSDSVAHHTHTVPKWVIEIFQNVAEGKPTVVFFDEINRAPVDVINAIMNTILEREYGSDSVILPHNAFIITAGNPDTDDYMVNPMDNAIKGRVVELEVSADYNEWKKNFVMRQVQKIKLETEVIKEELPFDDTVHSVVIQYLDEHPEAFLKKGEVDNETGTEKPGMDPRRWEMVSNLIKGFEITVDPKDRKDNYGIFKTCLDGLAGPAIAAQVFTFYKDNRQLTLDKLLKLVKDELKDVQKSKSKEDKPLAAAIEKAIPVYQGAEPIIKNNILDAAVEKYKAGKLTDAEFAFVLRLSPLDQISALEQKAKEDPAAKFANDKMGELESSYSLGIFADLNAQFTDLMKNENDNSDFFEMLGLDEGMDDIFGTSTTKKK